LGTQKKKKLTPGKRRKGKKEKVQRKLKRLTGRGGFLLFLRIEQGVKKKGSRRRQTQRSTKIEKEVWIAEDAEKVFVAACTGATKR